MPWSSGASCGVTSRAPIDASAILSEPKYCTSSIPAARATMSPMPAPAANRTPMNTT